MAKIRDLPEEVIILIFSFLNLRDRKIISRVSRLWNRLAFVDRPMRSIELRVSAYILQEDRNILLKSNRCYRNLQLAWPAPSSVEFLDKFGSGLDSLVLSTDEITLPVLVGVLFKTPKLKELIIVRNLLSGNCDMVLPVFDGLRLLQVTRGFIEKEVIGLIPRMFPNVTALHFNVDVDAALDLCKAYGQQLTFLQLMMKCADVKKFADLDCLENLRKLNVSWQDIQQPVRCFQYMKLVESASVGPMDNETFMTICAKWSHLKHLCVNVKGIKASTFKNITALKNLKTLKLWGPVREECFLKDIQLPKVTHLILIRRSSASDFYAHFASFVPNVEFLEISDDNLNTEDLKLLTRSVKNVRVLYLQHCLKVEDDSFSSLNCLTNLIELRCLGVMFPENAFQLFPKCPNLRSFRIISDSSTNHRISKEMGLQIPTAFPNLSELLLIECSWVFDETIRTLQERMQNCAVVKLRFNELDREAKPWEKIW